MGTGHAVLQCAGRVDGAFLVINGDDLYDPADLRKLAQAGRAALAKHVPDPALYGVYEVGEGNRVIRLVEKPVGVQGFFHILSGKKDSANAEVRKEAVEELRKGSSIDAVRSFLSSKVSADSVGQVLVDAVNEFNASPAGVKANQVVKTPKAKVVEDLPVRETLPDASTVKAHVESFAHFYDDMNDVIPIDPPRTQTASVQVGEMFNRSGIDSVL
jgi:hypothetical protein